MLEAPPLTGFTATILDVFLSLLVISYLGRASHIFCLTLRGKKTLRRRVPITNL